MTSEEVFYKGLTRPAMVFGVPITPLFFVCAFIALVALYVNLAISFLIFPAVFIMKEIAKKDEFIFRLLFLKLQFFSNPASKKFYQIKTYNASSYSKMSFNFDYPKISVVGLNQNPSFEKFIPYQTMINNVVITKDYDLLATWEIKGVMFEVESETDINISKEQLNILFRAFANEPVSFYFHNCRISTDEKIEAKFNNEFLKDLNDKYFNGFQKGSSNTNRLYLTAVYTPLDRITKSSLKKDSVEKRIRELDKYIKRLEEYCNNIQANLQAFGIKRLGIYTKDDIRYSEQLEFYNYLISGKMSPVRASNAPLFSYLNGNLDSIMFSSSAVQLNFNNGKKRFAKSIEIKDYSQFSYAGILDVLMYAKVEYTITQSFTPMAKVDAQRDLAKQKKQLISSEDDAVSQVEELDHALDELSSGVLCFGKYHFSIVVYADSVKEVEQKTNSVVSALSDLGFLVSVANIALPASYFSQFPANFGIRPRIHTISSKNYASLIALHNFPVGKKSGNCWGDAVTLLKTPNNQPYYFNFHETPENDSFGDFLLANTLIIGKSGGGKTVLMNFLLDQLCKFANVDTFPDDVPMQKRKATFFYLDKDKGAIGNIIAAGGKYLTIDGGHATGFNPFMVETNAENIRKLQILMKMLVTRNGEILTTLEEKNLNNAVESIMYNFDKDERKFGISLMLEHLTENINDTNSLKSRLALWAKNAKFGWVFDNEMDELNFDDDNINIYGIDGTDLLKDKEISGMVAFYILWRIMDLTDGRRFALFIDEAWDWISNSVVAEEVHNKEKTIRKLNGFLVLGTQSVEDFARSSIATAILEQSATILLLSNPKAKEDDYCGKLNLTQEEYLFAKNTLPSEYKFLIKKADERSIANINLSSVGKFYLKTLSTGKVYVEAIEAINKDINLTYEEKLKKLKELYA